MRGVEPPRLAAQPPQGCVYAISPHPLELMVGNHRHSYASYSTTEIQQRKCAQKEIRTPKPLRALPPEDSASTSFATWAYAELYYIYNGKGT